MTLHRPELQAWELASLQRSAKAPRPVSDYIGARALLSGLPDADWLLGYRGYDADWFREALKDKGIRA